MTVLSTPSVKEYIGQVVEKQAKKGSEQSPEPV
jgi:hypothetical protein